MVDHLQGGFQGVEFERAAEHADFNGVRVRKVDGGVAPGTGVFRVAHLVCRRELHAVPRRPTVHLALCAAAEPQEFRPELFDEIE